MSECFFWWGCARRMDDVGMAGRMVVSDAAATVDVVVAIVCRLTGELDVCSTSDERRACITDSLQYTQSKTIIFASVCFCVLHPLCCIFQTTKEMNRNISIRILCECTECGRRKRHRTSPYSQRQNSSGYWVPYTSAYAEREIIRAIFAKMNIDRIHDVAVVAVAITALVDVAASAVELFGNK